MKTRKIIEAMKRLVSDCRDPKTNELNHTLLAERTAEELDLYEDHYDYIIPEEVFEIAASFD
jgi:hypothetical protein